MIELSYNLGNHSPRVESRVRLVDHLAAVATSGFGLIGIDDWSVDRWESSGHSLEALRSLLDGLELGCSDVGPLRVGADRETLRAAGRLANAAAALGARWIPAVANADLPTARRLLAQAAEVIAPAGTGIAIEFIPWTGVPTLSAARQLVDEIGHPSVRVLVDTFQLCRSGGTWSELATTPAAQIGLVQLAGSLAPGEDRFDSSHNRTFPDEGKFDITPLAPTLAALGWGGVVSSEVLSASLRTRDPGEVAARAYAAARSCLAG